MQEMLKNDAKVFKKTSINGVPCSGDGCFWYNGQYERLVQSAKYGRQHSRNSATGEVAHIDLVQDL